MNYGIKEIDEFRAPSRKPWMVLLGFALLALIAWVSIAAWRGREKNPKPQQVAVTVTDVAAVTTTTVPPARRQSAKKPPVNLVAAAELKPSASAKADLARAKSLVAKGERVGARQLLLAGLASKLNAQERSAMESELGAINLQLAFLPYDMPEKVDHVVKRGDSLDKISKKYGVTVQSIQIGNDLKNPNLIKAGDHLRVLDADFSIEVSKGSHELVLLMNGKFFKRYKVGLGKFDKTPLGTFEVYDRIVEPVWWRPDGKEIPFGDKENILGTRWMAIRATGDTPPVRGYGIHGTWNEASIGKSESAGCVRMRNAEVQELFNLVPWGTKVTILK